MRTLVLVVVAVLLAAACGSSAKGPSTSSPSTVAQAPATIAVAASKKLGALLVDGAGRTLYLFEADKTAASTCYTACAQAWPPVVSGGAPHTGEGAIGSEIGTTTRRDGSVQVTYHGHPLYRYVSDAKPGDTTGQGLKLFGADWYAVSPAGNKIDNG